MDNVRQRVGRACRAGPGAARTASRSPHTRLRRALRTAARRPHPLSACTPPTHPEDRVTDTSLPASTATGPVALELDEVWHRVIAGLGEGQLSPQHRAWVNLTRP